MSPLFFSAFFYSCSLHIHETNFNKTDNLTFYHILDDVVDVELLLMSLVLLGNLFGLAFIGANCPKGD